MMVLAQGLGRLDVNLIEEYQSLCNSLKLPLEERNLIEESMKLSELLTLSYLWVLGAYELVRAVNQRLVENTELLGGQVRTRVAVVKHAFERLRIPLAKFKASKRHRETDSHIAYPTIHRELGISWQLSPDVLVSRRELADHLLGIMEEICSASDLRPDKSA